MAVSAQKALEERDVNVEKGRLLEALKANLIIHEAAYQEAIDGYQEKMLEEIAAAEKSAAVDVAKNIADARKRAKKFDPENPSSFRGGNFTIVQTIQLSLPVPQNYSHAYKKAIQIVEWENDKIMKLKYSEFVCFVHDEWDWKHQFNTINSMYSKKINQLVSGETVK